MEKVKMSKAKRLIVGLFTLCLVLVVALCGLFGCSNGEKAAKIPSDVTIHVSDDDVPLSGEGLQISDVVDKVASSVVEITTESVVTNIFMQQYVVSGAGSGVFISDNGYIVTNNHVIEDANTIKVRTTNGDIYSASLVSTDVLADIAVIKVEGQQSFPYATWLADSDTLKVGQDVIVIGNPLGSLGGSVSEGIISAKDRIISVDGVSMHLLQTTAAINPGNSGGGLFDMNGRLVGIVNAKTSATGIEGLGFAIPANTARSVATQLIDTGEVSGRKQLEIEASYITDAAKLNANGLGASNPGVFVTSAPSGSEFKTWDYIAAINGVAVSGYGQYLSIINSLNVGDTAEVMVYRRTGVTNGFMGSQITYRTYTISATVTLK